MFGGGLEEVWKRFRRGLEEDVSIDPPNNFRESSVLVTHMYLLFV